MTDARSLIARFRNEKPKPRAERDYMRTAGNVQETWWSEGSGPGNSDPGRPSRHDSSSHDGYREGSANSSALRPISDLHTRTAPLVGLTSAGKTPSYALSNRLSRGGAGFDENQDNDEYEDGFDRGYNSLQPLQRQHASWGAGRNNHNVVASSYKGESSRGPDDFGQSGFSAVDDLVFGDVQRLETVTSRTTREHFTMPAGQTSDNDDDSLDGRNVAIYSPPRASSTMQELKQQQQTVRSATRFRFTPSSQPNALHPPGIRPRPLALHNQVNLPGYGQATGEDGYEDEQSWERKSAALSHARRPVYAVSAGMLRGSAGLTSGAQIPSGISGDSKKSDTNGQESGGGGDGDDGAANDDDAGQSVGPSAYDASEMLDSTLALLQEKLKGGGGGGGVDAYNGGLSFSSYGGSNLNGGYMGGFDGDNDELPQSISAIREKLESGMLCFNLLYENKVVRICYIGNVAIVNTNLAVVADFKFVLS